MKSTLISILIAIALIGGAIWLSNKPSEGGGAVFPAGKNVSMEDGKQIVEIQARGGYQPRKSVAKAGIPTTLRFNTNGTFDCSLALRIPSMGISKILPQSGATDIDLGIPQKGTLTGTCGMGMYYFQVDFQN